MKVKERDISYDVPTCRPFGTRPFLHGGVLCVRASLLPRLRPRHALDTHMHTSGRYLRRAAIPFEKWEERCGGEKKKKEMGKLDEWIDSRRKSSYFIKLLWRETFLCHGATLLLAILSSPTRLSHTHTHGHIDNKVCVKHPKRTGPGLLGHRLHISFHLYMSVCVLVVVG